MKFLCQRGDYKLHHVTSGMLDGSPYDWSYSVGPLNETDRYAVRFLIRPPLEEGRNYGVGGFVFPE